MLITLKNTSIFPFNADSGSHHLRRLFLSNSLFLSQEIVFFPVYNYAYCIMIVIQAYYTFIYWPQFRKFFRVLTSTCFVISLKCDRKFVNKCSPVNLVLYNSYNQYKQIIFSYNNWNLKCRHPSMCLAHLVFFHFLYIP